jgi:hypothetical protein
LRIQRSLQHACIPYWEFLVLHGMAGMAWRDRAGAGQWGRRWGWVREERGGIGALIGVGQVSLVVVVVGIF